MRYEKVDFGIMPLTFLMRAHQGNAFSEHFAALSFLAFHRCGRMGEMWGRGWDSGWWLGGWWWMVVGIRRVRLV
jgi:hypothetical protein